VYSERLFSEYRNIIDEKRARLLPNANNRRKTFVWTKDLNLYPKLQIVMDFH